MLVKTFIITLRIQAAVGYNIDEPIFSPHILLQVQGNVAYLGDIEEKYKDFLTLQCLFEVQMLDMAYVGQDIVW